jgi:hypothetical protein
MAIEKFNVITPLHQAILDQFNTVTFAAKRLGYTKRTLYSWIKQGHVSEYAEKHIKAKGFDPVTFRHL